MKQAHIKAILEGVIPEVRSAIAAATQPLLDRIKELEARAPERGEKGDRGEDGLAGRDGIDGTAGRDGEKGEAGEKGETGETGEAGPQGEAGPAGDPGPQGDPGDSGEPGAQGPQGERGLDGQSVTIEDVAPIIEAEVAKKVALIPIPKDGAPGERGADGAGVTIDDVLPVIAVKVAEAVAELPIPKDGRDGKDGIGLAGAIIDRDGVLHVTMTDGKKHALGVVVGRDGAPGADAAPGKDGRDGLGFEDMSVAFDGKRTVTLRFERGDHVKEEPIKFAIPLDAGVWKEGEYEAGDQVTFRGHLWVAKKDTSTQPDTAPNDWRMAMRKPRDGRDGKPGDRGGPGPKGDKGDPGPRSYSG